MPSRRLEEVESDEGIEKVVSGAWMQAKPGTEFGQCFGRSRELGEEFHFNRAE